MQPTRVQGASGGVLALLLTAATFFFGGPLAGVVVLALATGLALVAWTPLGDYLGFGPGRPELEFVVPTDYEHVAFTTTDAFVGTTLSTGKFFDLHVVNRGNATAHNVWARLTFRSAEDGSLVLPKSLLGRWANNPQPDADPQPVSASSPKFTRTDIPANEQPEPLNIFVYFDNTQSLYAYPNENHMEQGRGQRYHLDVRARAVVVEVVVKADDGVKIEGTWEVQALTPAPLVKRLS